MAITKLGPLLSGIRGTVGGVTFSENGAGTFAKIWSPPSQPMTEKQTTQRSHLSRIPDLWRALTTVQKDAWATFAALPAQELFNSLGVSYYNSGYLWFAKCNTRLLRIGRSPIVAVPSQARPAAPSIDDFRVCVAGSESDLCCCGTATASTFRDAATTPAKAFDNNLVTQWNTAIATPTGWLKYVFPSAENVKRYRISISNFTLTRHPKDWTLEVWSAAAWQVIHTVSSMAFTANEWYEWFCPNPYTETDYRINITANQGDVDRLAIYEMECYSADLGDSVVSYPEDSFAAATDYDLILQISLGGSTGKRVQYPGFYEILATQVGGRWYALFQDELLDVFGTILENRSWFCNVYRQTQEGIRSAAAAERTETIIV